VEGHDGRRPGLEAETMIAELGQRRAPGADGDAWG